MVKRNRLRLLADTGFLMLLICLFVQSLPAGAVEVATHHNDAGRTGQNVNETLLTTSNVNVNTFGKLFARNIDGQMYAQPLYVPNLTIQGGAHNVVFAVTMHNSVYAFDADNPGASAPLWQVNLGTPVPSTDVCPTCNYKDISPEIGILSTPVIDTAGGTIYVVAKTKNTSNNTYHFHLHALDVTTGAEKFGGPVEITGQVSGTGAGSVSGTLSFDPLHHLNRPGLLLMNGAIYMAFGSLGDIAPYHGWVFGYDAGTLSQTGVFTDSPNGCCGSIWQAGQGLLGEGGNIYFMTGNGSFDANTGGKEYGDTFVKLSTSAGLSVSDYFTPYNQSTLSSQDLDLGSGGPMALPGTGLIVGMGKDRILRLLNTANMGGFNSTFNNDVQEFQATSGGIYMGGPIYWNSPNNGPVIYVWGPADYLKAYKFASGQFQTTPVSQSTVTENGGGSSAVPLSLSANGSQAGTGIIWAPAAYTLDPNQQTVGGIMRAFDATNLSVQLWNSKQNPTRDDTGSYAKFSPATIANGKVYVATFSGQLLAYGVNPPPPGPLPAPWASQDIGSVGVAGGVAYNNGTFTVSGSGSDIYGTADSFRYVYEPLNGDGQIIAKVNALDNTNQWAKAGIMIRESLTANSAHAMVDITPVNGAEFSRRLTTGGTTTATVSPGVAAPYWVKLVRSGNTFSGYTSADGVNWVLIATDTLSMGSSAYIGLIVTSHNNTAICTATINGVNVTAGTNVTPPTVSITSPANGASFTAPASITISANATAGTGATVTKVDFYAGSTLIGTDTTSPYSFTWNNVQAGSYSLTAKVTDSSGATATSGTVGITVTSSALPSPWNSQDVGSVGVTGSASYNNGTFTVSGSGSDIYGTADSFRYAYQSLNGDGQIIARVASLQNTNQWAKGGIMIRETLAANSAHAMVDITPVNGAEFSRRLTTGGTTTATVAPGVAAPYWVKLVRSGNTFSGYMSSDGVVWALIGSDTINMASAVYIGLIVTSHNNTVLCTTTMDGVNVGGSTTVPPTVGITSPSNGATFKAPAAITITAKATAGTGAAVSKVDFYSGSNLIGTDTTSPYSITWSNVLGGSYTLTARVTDTLGATATSSPVNITVNGRKR